jgi:oligopeptide transport system substrate-binding protein
MRTRSVILSIVILLLIGALPAAAHAPEGVTPNHFFASRVPTAGGTVLSNVTNQEAFRLTIASNTGWPPTLNINLGGEPLTLDPALATDTTSNTVIEQLFIGLTDQDDATAEIRPELATHWDVSSDGKTYTFTLRGDAVWSDGNPITAQDVRYGILRTLDPATKSDYAAILYPIKNAEQYNNGTVTDPAQVGVAAPDNTHLQIVLAYPTSAILGILSHWVARPMPKQAIDAHGSDWTQPANIVTSGAYRLTEWAHGDHILLDKNPSYFDAANVQITQVKMWMVDEATAWGMYLNGGLDTVAVPVGTSLTPVLRQELFLAPGACTYYYGFSIAQPPFDKSLVRKAFIAATDRQGLVSSVTGGIQRPALTFAPPGVFGHVDGAAEGVGIPYNPTQARQWLAAAGYPNGQGLPSITLWFNTSAGQQAIAEYIRDSWFAALGVEVTLSDMAWSDYLQEYRKGNFQVWRMSWCADYLDAYNFLRDAVDNSSGGYGGWNNSTYEGLLDQAARTADPDTRKALYKQAEEILVETDAVMLPLYFPASAIATKPYLERTFPAAGGFDISTWRDTRVRGTATPASGGTVTSYSGDTTIQVPVGTFADPVTITEAPATGMPPGGNMIGIHHLFDVSAVYSNTGLPAQPDAGKAYNVAVHYTDIEKGPTIEDTLRLYGWDGSAWSQQGISSSVDTANNLVTAQVNHFSLFAVLGETQRVFLPIAVKGN